MKQPLAARGRHKQSAVLLADVVVRASASWAAAAQLEAMEQAIVRNDTASLAQIASATTALMGSFDLQLRTRIGAMNRRSSNSLVGQASCQSVSG